MRSPEMTMRPIDIDALSMDGIRAGAFDGRPITVLGLARSGIALARFLHDHGARVTVYDGRPASALERAIAQLDDRSVTLCLGPDTDPASTWADAVLVTTSPSITPDFNTTEPRLRGALQALVAARAAGDATVPALVSESDLFLRLCPSPTVGVTGTKGKTTTSSLAHAILAADPSHPAILGGNIGTPLIERLPELTPQHRVVVELSELQLPALSRGTTVAAYTNVTSDHLDRHGSVEAYRRVKRRLAELVDPDGALVLNLEDPVVGGYAGLGTAPLVLYRNDRPVPGGLGVLDGWVVSAAVERLPLAGGGIAQAGPGGGIMPVDELGIPGRHNVSNALAAIAIGMLFGVAPDAIRRAAAAFPGVEHRLQSVGLIDGVRFVNDSQGTQPDAVIAALRAFPAPVVLIAGGRDKGVDLSELARVVAGTASGAVLIGESGPTLEAMFRAAGLARTAGAATLDEAVVTADAFAHLALGEAPEGSVATVVLSPAAASFDMFEDYAARGRAFIDAVGRLAVSRGTRQTTDGRPA
ncbi:MAG TPA: UDP-N-acetylmuramoyl-L-alanine--D-glutamate ligase [Candidatus Limnocylindrales bacterium]|nr:UDP-N-acetylmuramoyl-L-alanine--D-glutamate ligase [Candidatus Limnocylindrales bacterium]